MLSATVVALALMTPLTYQAGTRSSDGRSYVTGYFALDLDGINCGIIQKFSGGDTEGSVSLTRPTVGVGGTLPAVQYNPFEVQMGLSMGQPIKDWIDATLAKDPNSKHLRKSGEIRSADFKRDVRQIREFKDALLTEIGFPACDAAAKGPAYMTLKFSPWIIRNKKGDGSKVDNPADMAQKQWHPTDFKFSIDGLDATKVKKIESITIKQTVVTDRARAMKVPGRLEYPNIRFTIPAEYAKPFYKWHEDFVINKNNPTAKHKMGSLVYLNRTRQKELLTLTFTNLGIFKVSTAASTKNEDRAASVVVELYVEGMKASFR